MNFKELEKIIKADGWTLKEVDGSHYHYKHPSKKGKVTIPNHGSRDLNIKTIRSVLRQAGMGRWK
ncbi:MAG: type II toxin-antitoxin system HicA family toxin [Holophagaceae bacterium]|nr:type II toxin-antitoxin system HicA family toxin [Holophagaceae bacterium]